MMIFSRLTFPTIFLSMFISSLVGAHEQHDLRLVSASNPLTQIVSSLNKDHLFVGLDKTSHTKPEFEKIPDIGYRIQLSTEGILSLKPDLIFLAHDSGPNSTIEQLKNSNVEVIQFDELTDVLSMQNTINVIAEKLNVSEAGQQLNQKVSKDAKDLLALSSQHPTRKGFFVMQNVQGHGSAQISGSDTTADKFLDLLNINNVFSDEFQNYRAIPLESQIQKQPEIVLIGHAGQFETKGEKNYQPFQRKLEGMQGWPKALQPKCVFDVNMSDYLVFGIHIYANNIKLLEAINECLLEN